MPGKNEFDWDDCDLQHDSKILIFQVSPQKPTSVSEVKEPLTIAQASTPASAPLNSETFQSVNRGKAPSDRNEPAQPVFESDHETEEGMIKWCGLDVKRGDAVFARVGKKPIYSPCKVQNYDPKTCMYQLLAPPNNPQPSPLPRTAFFCRSDPEFVSCKLDPRAVAAYTDTSGSAYNNMRTLPSSVAQHMPAVLQAMHGIVTGARPSAFMDALRRGDVGALQNLVYMSRTADVLADDIEEAAFEREVRDGVMMSSDWANGFCRDENGIEAALRRDRLVCWVLVPEGLKILKGLLPGRGVAGDTRKSPDQWVKRLLILRETLSLGRKMQSDMSL
ncbi:hypothetical protein BC830DRAFT_425655 [Chytriomyces sp. MP71]|nr:hypothetical protein BC830DRAFT_425655 [Chytriomyces sp. MP71]